MPCNLVRRGLTWLVKTDSEGCQLTSFGTPTLCDFNLNSIHHDLSVTLILSVSASSKTPSKSGH